MFPACYEVEGWSIRPGYATLLSLCSTTIMQKGNICPMQEGKHDNEQH